MDERQEFAVSAMAAEDVPEEAMQSESGVSMVYIPDIEPDEPHCNGCGRATRNQLMWIIQPFAADEAFMALFGTEPPMVSAEVWVVTEALCGICFREVAKGDD